VKAAPNGPLVPSSGQAAQYPGLPLPLDLDRLSHHLRGGNNRFQSPIACSDPTAAPRIADETHPFALTTKGIPVASTGTDAGVAQSSLPQLVAQPYGGKIVNGCLTIVRSIAFTDVADVRSETWTLGWEGPLPGTLRSLGRFDDDGHTVTLTDPGGTFCNGGVRAGDKLVIPGCKTDDDCDTAQFCARDPSAPADVVDGLCLDRGPNQFYQTLSCAPLLRAVRRFRVLSAKQHT